eukprot:2530387-Rhodomonas_salina.1
MDAMQLASIIMMMTFYHCTRSRTVNQLQYLAQLGLQKYKPVRHQPQCICGFRPKGVRLLPARTKALASHREWPQLWWPGRNRPYHTTWADQIFQTQPAPCQTATTVSITDERL